MASAWGAAWAGAWGNSWGDSGVVIPPAPAQTAEGIDYRRWFWAIWQARRSGVAKGATFKISARLVPGVAIGGRGPPQVTSASIKPGRARGQLVADELLVLLAEIA